MRVTGSLGCRAPPVTVKHLAGLPATELHQVALGPTSTDPLVSKRMAKLVGVDLGDACHRRPTFEELGNTRARQWSFRPEPKRGAGSSGVTTAHPQVTVDGSHGGGPNWRSIFASLLLPVTTSVEWSKSTSVMLTPASSARRMPQSSSNVRIAPSLRSSNRGPAQVPTSRRTTSGEITGTEVGQVRVGAQSEPWDRWRSSAVVGQPPEELFEAKVRGTATLPRLHLFVL